MENLTWNLSFWLYIFCVMSLLNTEKGIRIKQLTDVTTIVVQELYYVGLNKIKYWVRDSETDSETHVPHPEGLHSIGVRPLKTFQLTTEHKTGK